MPSSGPISMQQAHAEFGLGYNLSAYYGCDAGVPTSGAISLSNLYGKRKRTAYNYFCIVMNNQSIGASHFSIAEIEFRETVGGVKFAVNPSYSTASGGNTENWYDGNTVTYENTYYMVDQYASVLPKAGSKVLRQLAMYVSNGSPGPRNVKIYGSNTGGIPNPPTMTGWDLLMTYNNPTQVWNGWFYYNIP